MKNLLWKVVLGSVILGAVLIGTLLIFSSFVGKKTKHIGGDGGSMYPTLSWCTSDGGPEDCSKIANTQNRRVVPELNIKGKDFVPQRGMIVEVSHGNSNYGKRIVGLPGDSLLINDGYLYINGVKADEPYLWKPGMTYGDDFLHQCEELVIPTGKMMVMGDNRPLSNDGRSFGLLDISEITSYLPLSMQNDIRQLWGTFPEPHIMTDLEIRDFVDVLNKVRNEKGLHPVTIDAKMNSVALAISKIRVEGSDISGSPSKDTSTKVVETLDQIGYQGRENLVKTIHIFGAYDIETYKYMLAINKDLQSRLLKPELVKIGVGVYKGKTSTACSAGLSTFVMSLE